MGHALNYNSMQDNVYRRQYINNDCDGILYVSDSSDVN
jgi:hypothetical protein